MDKIKKTFRFIFLRNIIKFIIIFVSLIGIRIVYRLFIFNAAGQKNRADNTIFGVKIILVGFIVLVVVWYIIYMHIVKRTFKNLNKNQQTQYAVKVKNYLSLEEIEEENVYWEDIFLYEAAYSLGIMALRYSQIKEIDAKSISGDEIMITYYTDSVGSIFFKEKMEKHNVLKHVTLLKSKNENITVRFL